jgi:YHS domain-containing protein
MFIGGTGGLQHMPPPSPAYPCKEVMPMAKDPVCGMMVDEKKAPATSEYKGKTYYFCAKGCKVAFDKDPEKFLSAKPGDMKTGH